MTLETLNKIKEYWIILDTLSTKGNTINPDIVTYINKKSIELDLDTNGGKTTFSTKIKENTSAMTNY